MWIKSPWITKLKTQVICTLAHYFYAELGKPTLILCPQRKPLDELVKRYRLLYDENLPVGWDGDLGVVMAAGLLQKKIVKDPQSAKVETKKLEKYSAILVDEVEYCMNPGGFWVLDRIKNPEYAFGFSGSADKYHGSCLSFQNGITGAIMDNKEVVKYFGPSLVHRQPVSNKVNIIKVKTLSLDFLEFGENEINDDNNIYIEINNAMWTNPMVIEAIEKVICAYPKLYIPINNLESVISTWMDYWKGKFRMLVICGKGYLYFDKKGNMSNLTLEEAVEVMKNNEVDVIPSTSSGFRALDFPGLNNMLMVAGRNAGIILQTVGRTARQQEMNIIHLAPKKFKMIPVYSKGDKARVEMIENYYSYCEINHITIEEEDLIAKI